MNKKRKLRRNKKRKLRRKKNVNDYNPDSVEILQAVEYFLNSGGEDQAPVCK